MSHNRSHTSVLQPVRLLRTVLGAFLAVGLALITAGLVAAPLASAVPGDDEDTGDYRFYTLASNVSSYFSLKTQPDGGGLDPGWAAVGNNPGSAGAMLSYAHGEGVLGWLRPGDSNVEQNPTYESLKGIENAGAVVDYGYFGATLQALGLDSTYEPVGLDPMIRGVAGALMIGAFAFASLVPMLMWMAIQLLKLLNPFVWFHEGIKRASPAYAGWVDNLDNVNSDPAVWGDPGDASSFVGSIAVWYKSLVELSWEFLIPLMVGFVIMGMLLFKKLDKGSMVKKLIVRMLFIVMGLPLIGGIYTSTLNQFDDDMMSQSGGPAEIILSTYVDFSTWIADGRLHLPDGAVVEWDPKSQSPTARSQYSVRHTALLINANLQDPSGNRLFPGLQASGQPSSPGDALKNATIEETKVDARGLFNVVDLLIRYTASEYASASGLEAGFQANIGRLDGLAEGQAQSWFLSKQWSTPSEMGEESSGDNVAPGQHPVLALSGDGLRAAHLDSGQVRFTSTGNPHCGFQVASSTGDPVNCNLSPLAAFNYLNSNFGPDSVKLESSAQSLSGITRTYHVSVSQVGGGAAGFMYWVSAFTNLACIGVIGLSFAVSMMVNAIKRTLGLVASIPLATMGSLAAIAKFLSFGAALILELMVTMFAYMFVTKILVMVPNLIQGLVLTWTKPAQPGEQLSSFRQLMTGDTFASVAIVLMTLLGAVLLIAVTRAMLAMRKSVVKGIDEAVTKLIDKFLDTTTPPGVSGGGGGVMPAVAGGLGSGLGMAAGQAVRNKFGGSKSNSNSTPPKINGTSSEPHGTDKPGGPGEPGKPGDGTPGAAAAGADGPGEAPPTDGGAGAPTSGGESDQATQTGQVGQVGTPSAGTASAGESTTGEAAAAGTASSAAGSGSGQAGTSGSEPAPASTAAAHTAGQSSEQEARSTAAAVQRSGGLSDHGIDVTGGKAGSGSSAQAGAPTPIATGQSPSPSAPAAGASSAPGAASGSKASGSSSGTATGSAAPAPVAGSTGAGASAPGPVTSQSTSPAPVRPAVSGPAPAQSPTRPVGPTASSAPAGPSAPPAPAPNPFARQQNQLQSQQELAKQKAAAAAASPAGRGLFSKFRRS